MLTATILERMSMASIISREHHHKILTEKVHNSIKFLKRYQINNGWIMLKVSFKNGTYPLLLLHIPTQLTKSPKKKQNINIVSSFPKSLKLSKFMLFTPASKKSGQYSMLWMFSGFRQQKKTKLTRAIRKHLSLCEE